MVTEGELEQSPILDDAVNATNKSTAYDVVIEVNGGIISVDMADGDTDGFDANGTVVLNGGEVTVNGEIVTEIVQSQKGVKAKRSN